MSYAQFNLKTKNKPNRTVTEFPWESSKLPCPWDNSKYARVMIPYNATEQRKHKERKQHVQIVSRRRLSQITSMAGFIAAGVVTLSF